MTDRVSSRAFVDALTAEGFGPYVGVPCSYLRPFIDYVIDREDLSYIAATNEGEALAIAAGAQIAGRRPVVMLQNSGLGNLVNPLASLNFPFRIPALLIVTLRGDPAAARPDEPQHELMGQVTGELLTTLRVAHEWFPASDGEIGPAIARAVAHQDATGLPYAFILRKGVVTEYAGQSQNTNPDGAFPSRREALEAVGTAIRPETVVVATTGKTGREWFELGDRARNLYLVGSMGCAPSVALGIARERADPIVVLDGDGAALMRLEAMTTVGHLRPERFVHILLDNQAYDSTGGQHTISAGVDFPGVAWACGYATATRVESTDELSAAIGRAQAAPGPHFIYARIAVGSPPEVARPALAPHEVAARLRAELRGPR